MDLTTTISAETAAPQANVSVTVTKVFEIRAADKQAVNLLETVDEVNGRLEVARSLRKQKSGLLSAGEKSLMERAFQSTENAVSRVSKLVEPCQVATETDDGGTETGTRLLFVLRDSPNIQVSRHRLELVNESLHTALTLLRSRGDATATQSAFEPPTYEESQFLTASRARNMLRRASSNISSDEDRDHDTPTHRSVLARLAEDGDEADAVADTEVEGRRDSQSSRHELFFGDDIETSPRRATASPAPFLPYLPYRPGPSSISTTSLDSESWLPTILQPGSSHAVAFEADQVKSSSSSIRDDEPSDDGRTGGFMTTLGWQPNPAPWAKALPRPAYKSASWSGPRVVDVTRNTKPAADELCTSLNTVAKSTFAIPCDSVSILPRPLFSKMVKIDNDLPASETIQRVKASVRRKVDSRASTSSEFPEVVPTSGLEVALPYPMRDGNSAELKMPYAPLLATEEKISLVTEVPSGMMDAARQRRSTHARDSNGTGRRRNERNRKPQPRPRAHEGLIPTSTENDASEQVRRWSDNTLLRPAVAVPMPPANTNQSETLTGRARSQRWREAQFEKFEQLQNMETK